MNERPSLPPRQQKAKKVRSFTHKQKETTPNQTSPARTRSDARPAKTGVCHPAPTAAPGIASPDPGEDISASFSAGVSEKGLPRSYPPLPPKETPALAGLWPRGGGQCCCCCCCHDPETGACGPPATPRALLLPQQTAPAPAPAELLLSPFATATAVVGSEAGHGWVQTGLSAAGAPEAAAVPAAAGGDFLLPPPPLWSPCRVGSTSAPLPPSFDAGIDVPLAQFVAPRTVPPPPPPVVAVELSLAWARDPLAGLGTLAQATEAAVLEMAVACICWGYHFFWRRRRRQRRLTRVNEVVFLRRGGTCTLLRLLL